MIPELIGSVYATHIFHRMLQIISPADEVVDEEDILPPVLGTQASGIGLEVWCQRALPKMAEKSRCNPG